MSGKNFSYGEIDMKNESFRFLNQENDEENLYSQITSVIQIVSLLMIIAVGLAGNFYICSVIYKNRNLRNPTFIFMVNLAVANIGALLFCTPFPLIVSWQKKFELGTFWCCTNGFFNNLFFCVSIFTLSFITMHKYCSVTRPSIPRCFYMNETKSKLSILALWIVCGTLSLLVMDPFNDWKNIAFNASTAHCGISFPRTTGEKLRLAGLALLAFIVPIVIMSYGYWKIYTRVATHARRVSLTLTSQDHVSPMKRKLAITLCLMFTTFVVCWFPFFLLISLSLTFDDPKRLPYSLGRIAYWFGYFNCAVNPTVYCLRMSAFKEAGFKRSSTHEVTQKNTPRGRRAFSLPTLSFTDLPKSSQDQTRKSKPQISLNISKSHVGSNKVLNERRRSYACSSTHYDESSNHQLKVNKIQSQSDKPNPVGVHVLTPCNKRRCSHYMPTIETAQESFNTVEVSSVVFCPENKP